MEKQTPNGRSLVIDAPAAPEVYVSSVVRADIEAGNVVKLTFVSLHADLNGSASASQVVNLRLVMSLDTAQDMHRFLGEWFQRLALAAHQKPEDAKVQ